jgi:hypothetical protein
MTVGTYEIAKDPLWDPEMERWYIHIGIQTKKGIEIHYTAIGKTPEIVKHRAEMLARVMTIQNIVNH